ncbi:MAG: hydrogenase expression/formation protein HypE [Nitrospirales bacterium]|nr:hydrogenase expression/formation protein HypE [Nitrospirales bacterium]
MREGARILLSHGSGGTLSRQLIHDLFLDAFRNEYLAPLNDQAVFSLPSTRIAFTTDSYVVSPLFFPGGDIGKLAVCGTINDLAVGGAEPLYLSASFIIEEGLLFEDLKRIVASMAETAEQAGVQIVTGDTKVVERGKGDKVFITTAGVGIVGEGIALSPASIRPGDVVIVSGCIGDHGVAVLTCREGIRLETPVGSDCAPLHGLARSMLAAHAGIRAMRDPTRGGLATALNEFAAASGSGIIIEEEAVPVREAVQGACELLGFDPLYLANEGKLVAVVPKNAACSVLDAMRGNVLGADAAVIGEVVSDHPGRVTLKTAIGTRRTVSMLSGEQLPRIC